LSSTGGASMAAPFAAARNPARPPPKRNSGGNGSVLEYKQHGSAGSVPDRAFAFNAPLCACSRERGISGTLQKSFHFGNTQDADHPRGERRYKWVITATILSSAHRLRAAKGVLAHTRRRRGTGNSTGRAGRYAKCTEPKPFVPSAPINAGHELPESRMKGNFHVRFGGGRLEKGQQCHLASRLPNEL
jgi:hypothetical protein